MQEPSFESVAEFVREWARLRSGTRVVPESQFERDLGITGDDGTELLDAAATRFDVKFKPESFDLAPNEYLFNSEGMDLLGVLWRMLRRTPEPEVRALTVGELHSAILHEQKKRRYST